eukprot:scaffold11500_cov144-Skeletonema_menzelii.AAC.2
MKEDFLVTVSDENGGEQTILIWVPLAILAHNVVLEKSCNQSVAHKASLAVVQHGKEVDYTQKLSVRRQIIMSARKAADAVIEELGNGDVAAAVLEAVREGGELLTANASGIAIGADDTGGDNTSSNLINITLSKPLGIIFEPISDPQECGVRILDLPRGGKAYNSGELKVGDELLFINNMKLSSLTYYQVVNFISQGHDQKQFNFIFQRPNKRGRKAKMDRRTANQQAEQRDDRNEVNPNPNKRNAGRKGTLIAEQGDDGAPSPIIEPIPVKRSDDRKGKQPAEHKDNESPVPAPYQKTMEPNAQDGSVASLNTYDTFDTYGSSYASEGSSVGLFGLWPKSKQPKSSEDSFSPSALQKDHPYHPSHLIPGWTVSSVASTAADTVESSYSLSRAINKFDLSTLLGRAFPHPDLGRDYSFIEARGDQSYQSSQGDQSYQSSQSEQSTWASTVEDSSCPDDHSSAASVNVDDKGKDAPVVVSGELSGEPTKGRRFLPIKVFKSKVFKKIRRPFKRKMKKADESTKLE